jgi:hypothetical protein
LEESWDKKPAEKASFCAWWWEDIIEKSALKVHTCGTQPAAKVNKEGKDQSHDYWTYPNGKPSDIISLDEDWEKCAQLLLAIQPQLEQEFAVEYPYFKNKIIEEEPNPNTVVTLSRFQKGQQGLLYFIDANWNTRLCIPQSKIGYILIWTHESPYELVPASFWISYKECSSGPKCSRM